MIHKHTLRLPSRIIMLILGLLLANTAHADTGPPPPPPGHGLTPFQIKVFLQGFYQGNGLMQRAMDHDGTDVFYRFADPIAERITIELHTPGQYGEKGFTFAITDVNLLNNGWAVADLPSEGTYFITIKTRNHLETVSSEPIDFALSPREYNFTDAAGKAFGSNQMQLEPGVFGIYAGDIDQDGSIDINDSGPSIISVRSGDLGYIVTDITGSGSVDINDSGPVIINVRAGIQKQTP